MVGAQLEEAAGVDDVADDVAHVVRLLRTSGTAAAARAVAVERVGIGHPRRVVEVVIGQVVEDRSEAGQRVGVILDDEGGHTASEAVHGRAAEVHGADGHAGERGHSLGSGDVQARRSSSTWSTSPSTRAGPDTHGPTTASSVGTTPTLRSGHAHRPAACSDSTPSPTSAPDVATASTTGTPSSIPRRTARSSASPRPRRSRRGACRRRGGTS